MTSTLTNQGERTERRFRMPYDDYFRMVDDTTHSEWVDGEVTVFMPPARRHQFIHAFMFGLLLMYARATKRGKVVSEPFEMQLRSGRSYREPDILVVLEANLHRIDDQRLNGPADLIVEILSPDSVRRDRDEKFREYEQAGVPEYWIVDGRDDSHGVVAYTRSEAGRYAAIPPDKHGRIHSLILPGFWIDTAWLTADELPNEYEVMCHLLPQRFTR